jgi:hypothetical protein
LSYWFQTRWFLCEFPIGSYVKLVALLLKAALIQVSDYRLLGASGLAMLYINFVDHGENFANGENGMDKLTDKVKQIYDT